MKADLQLLRDIGQRYFQLPINDGMSRRWLLDQEAPPGTTTQMVVPGGD